ncbi:MAG: Regulatory protein RecX [Modestobacter sp.]|nr:Regulatory protein RecX [Modestobacter sp.]
MTERDPWSAADTDGEGAPAGSNARRSGRRRSAPASGRSRDGTGAGFGEGRRGRAGSGRSSGADTARGTASGDESSEVAADDRDPVEVARGICLRALTGASKTRQQLADLLAKREIPLEAAEAVLDRFTEVGLIDDAAFAAAWVSSRQSGRGLARRALAQELRAKGVDGEVAAAAVAEVDPQDEWDTARRLVERKARGMARLDRVTAERRLVGMLARKGYGGGLAAIVAREAMDAVYADADLAAEADDPDDDLEDAEDADELAPAGGAPGGRGRSGLGGGGFGGRSGGGGFGGRGGGFGAGGFGGRKSSRGTAGGKPNGGGLGGGGAGGIAGQRAAGMADEVGEGHWVGIGRRIEPTSDGPS